MPYKQAEEQARTLLLDYVGPEYDQGTLPRVLFLSLDPGSSLPTPADRTIAALQRDESTCNVYLLPRGRHWYETHELALILLQPFDPMLPLQGICRYFAHANSAKCCANNPGRRQGSWQMFEKCKGYVPGEIAALRPAILVTQGQAARLAVRAQFQVLRPLSQPSCEAALIDVDGRAVIWLACVFHGFLPPSPWEGCHSIHVKPATQSTRFLPPSPRESCHVDHGKVATYSRRSLPPSERSDAGR